LEEEEEEFECQSFLCLLCLLEERVKELQQAVHFISESLNAIEKMLKIIRKEQENE